VGAYSAWFVQILMGLTAVIAWPLSKILDAILGTEEKVHQRNPPARPPCPPLSVPSRARLGGLSSPLRPALLRGAKWVEKLRVGGAKRLEKLRVRGTKGLEKVRVGGAKGLEKLKVRGTKGLEKFRVGGVKGLEKLRDRGAKSWRSVGSDGLRMKGWGWKG
jgi:hypothetical protein